MTTAQEVYEWLAARPDRILPQKRPGTHYTGGWVAPGPVWRGEKPRPTGILSLRLPARSQSLHQISYPDTHTHTSGRHSLAVDANNVCNIFFLIKHY